MKGKNYLLCHVYTVSITNDQHAHTCTHIHTHTHSLKYTHIHTRMHTHTHTHTHTQQTYSVKCKKCFLNFAELIVFVVKFLGGSNLFGGRPVVDCV